MPCPYDRTELRTLRATINERWPKLQPDEALRWLRRVKEEKSPYSRVRVHAIRCQLDCVVALALHAGLRRAEIFALDTVCLHPANNGVVVLSKRGDLEIGREVPLTARAREAVKDWIECRWFLSPSDNQIWRSLHAESTMRDPMSQETFNALLRTYIGPGWTLKRLRDTCAAAWVRAGMPLEHLRKLLGLARIEDALPYARLVRGSLDGSMETRDELFTSFVEPNRIAA